MVMYLNFAVVLYWSTTQVPLKRIAV